MAASVFRLNGHDCLYPEQLYDEFSRLELDTSDWYFQANQFIQNRGTTPSWGMLLCKQESVDNFADKTLIVFTSTRNPQRSGADGVLSFPVQIEWSRKLGGHASLQNKGYNLVKVIDERYALNELVGKRFNHVIDYITPAPDAPPEVKGIFVYHPKSLKDGGSQPQPYTWQELFNECWKLPSGATLDFDGFQFPTYTPQDLDWRYSTRKEVLDMLLQWTGGTIEYDLDKGSWKVVSIEGNADFSQYSKIIAADTWLQTKEPGESRPSNVKFYFAKIDQSDNDVEPFQVITKTPSGFNVTMQELHLRLPAHYAADFKSPNLPQAISDEFLAQAKKRWDQFPSQEKTFFGYLPIHPNGKVERVTYYQYHDKCCTHVETVLKRVWLITPNQIDGETVSHVFGIVLENALPISPYIRVAPLSIIAGRIRDGVTELKVLNRHQQLYQAGDKIDVFQRTDDQFWSTYKTGEGGGDRVVRFELYEDMNTTDSARRAYLLDVFGSRVFIENAVPFLISVRNDYGKHQGYAQWLDPTYGDQRGYSGAALALSYSLVGLEQYFILDIEHQARYIEGVMPGEQTADGRFDFIPGTTGGYALPGFNYWDGRAPKTFPHTFGESTDAVTHNVVEFVDWQKMSTKLVGGSQVKLIWDEVVLKYKLWGFKKPGSDGTLLRGYLVKNIPKAQMILFQDAGGIDQNDITYDFESGIVEGAVIVAEQEKDDDGNPLNRYRTKYLDAARTKPDIRTGVNVLESELRGSFVEPAWVLGREITVLGYENGEQAYIQAFEIIRDDVKGTYGFDKSKTQIKFHRAGQSGEELGGKKCGS